MRVVLIVAAGVLLSVGAFGLVILSHGMSKQVAGLLQALVAAAMAVTTTSGMAIFMRQAKDNVERTTGILVGVLCVVLIAAVVAQAVTP